MMELPSIFHFKGWRIRYALSVPSDRGTILKTIVFVHGTPWSSTVYAPLTGTLSGLERYKILVYDLPGYGQSQHYSVPPGQQKNNDLFEGDTSFAFQAEALHNLLKEVGIQDDQPAVIAHDIAGAIVLRTHLIHGLEIGSLLLMDTNTVLPWGDGFYKLVRAEPEVFLKLPPTIYEAVVRAVIQSAVCNPNKLKSGWEDDLAIPWLPSSEEAKSGLDVQRNFVRQIAQSNDQDVQEMLDQNLYTKVRCPVKILQGEKDEWIPKEKIDRLAGMLGPQLKGYVAIPEAGHLIMVDQPEKVAIEVFDWLSKY